MSAGTAPRLRAAVVRLTEFSRTVGPGLISGFSDNDPTTVATLAVIGASTVYGLAWLVLLVIPMLAVVQAVAARVGTVSKRGLENCIRMRYGAGLALAALLAVLAVTVVTLAADLEGGGAALEIVTGIGYRWWVLPLAAATAAALVFARYEAVARVLKFLSLIFVAYIVTTFLAHPNWLAVLRGSLVPHYELNDDYVSGSIALLGTTLTSYAYVWETVETSRMRAPLRRIGLVQAEAALGIVLAGITFWFIVVATGATLGVHHKHVETAQDAANALVPVAGRFAGTVFAIGLLGSALIAIPVLAGTSAYVVKEAFNWRGSLDADISRASGFYATLTASLAVAAAVALLGVPPIKLLFISGIAGGIATPFTLGLLLLVAGDHNVMGPHTVSKQLIAAGWVVAAIVVAATLVYLYRLATGSGS